MRENYISYPLSPEENLLYIISMYLSRAEINPIELYNSTLQPLQIHLHSLVQIL